MSDIAWGKKVEVRNLGGELVIVGHYLEYDEELDLYWVSVEGKDMAYCGDEFTVSIPKPDYLLHTFHSKDKKIVDHHKEHSYGVLYSSNNKVWRMAPSNRAEWSDKWAYIAIRNTL